VKVFRNDEIRAADIAAMKAEGHRHFTGALHSH